MKKVFDFLVNKVLPPTLGSGIIIAIILAIGGVIISLVKWILTILEVL